MPSHVVLIEKPEDWPPAFPSVKTLTAREYLGRPDLLEQRGTHLINLCRSYRYLSTGYYCSLLAGARGHRVLPTVSTLADLSRRLVYLAELEDLEPALDKALGRQSGRTDLVLPIYFGTTSEEYLAGLARQIFELFPCPILQATLRRKERWTVTKVQPLSLNRLPLDDQARFAAALEPYLGRKPWYRRRSGRSPRYDLAILHEPGERKPPSNPAALRRFVQAGRRMGVAVELIERKDYGRLLEFDALFLRVTTTIDHYTYRFARRAQREGIVVIDDPDSILRCTNKVYQAELLAARHIPHPRTVILQKGDHRNPDSPLGYPVVLKVPDGSFSRGVFKADNGPEFRRICAELFKESDLILAQEFIYTPFDWRIGILNHTPLHACRYFMSRRHWQIVKYERSGKTVEGGFETLAVEQAPQAVVETALRAARLIGDGLYGVDLKETENGVRVVEINDNPSLAAGVEDRVLGEELYRRIIAEFVRRIDNRRDGGGRTPA